MFTRQNDELKATHAVIERCRLKAAFRPGECQDTPRVWAPGGCQLDKRAPLSSIPLVIRVSGRRLRVGVSSGSKRGPQVWTEMNKPERNGSGIANEEIAVGAYHLWEAAGRPDGQAVEHWLEAEALLRSKRSAGKHTMGSTIGCDKPERAWNIRYGLVLKS